MEMYQVRIMNSTSAGRTKIYDGNTTIADIMSDPEVSGLLVGATFAWNASVIDQNDFHKTLVELNATPDRINVLCSMKAANGNL